MIDPSSLIWVGPVVPPAEEHRIPAVSPAGNRWQFSLLRSLAEIQPNIHCVGYCPERTFPFGKLFLPCRMMIEQGVPITHVSALNVKGLREVLIANQIRYVIEKDSSSSRLVVLYNLSDVNYNVAKRLDGARSRPAVIVADGSRKDFRRLKELRKKKCKAVFLAWSDYLEYGIDDDLHLDGGVDSLLPQQEADFSRPIVGYHGALGCHGGLSLLLRAWARVPHKNALLYVTGKGDASEIVRAAKVDRRIRYLGCVPKLELEEIQQKVSVFVNPRPTAVIENRHNFPSKLVEYIGSGRYVVSTRSPGISPDFEPHCIWAECETPEAIAIAICRALAMAQTGNFPESGRKWVSHTRLWTTQAEKFFKWVHS